MLTTLGYAKQALGQWTARQILMAALAAIAVGLLIGIATVLIPNPVFARDIPPVWWNYPVWIVTSIISGMLIATYIQPVSSVDEDAIALDPTGRQGKLGMLGGFLSWFAVGCPVCNKLALIAFGYFGAITYFAPIQPFLGVAALLLTSVALLWRLKEQIVCRVAPTPPANQSFTQEHVSTRL
ncbi:hypothetical protein [Enteractinococcus coprophilus]|uniref:Uncharacterized protein n=1 Tax=Enteractinococcus coprophilus TaxID=1027633 RepID=A0A543AP10_9MICC|nr:hypothetical protein [Enteractinococcus coprophilus]TQL74314.1 hypothetical protein FB556_0775 [Enteractinococcus coprophilus]